MIRILINGSERTLESAHRIDEMVAELGLIPATLLVEHNGLALRRSEWTTTKLSDGDRIELLQIAAGG